MELPVWKVDATDEVVMSAAGEMALLAASLGLRESASAARVGP